MRKNRAAIVCGCAMFASSYLLHEGLCFAQDKEAASIEGQISEAENSWNHGDHGNYYSRAAAIAKEIRANPSKTNPNGPASKLLKSLLAKKADLREVDNSDLSTMQALAALLASHDEVPNEDRRATASLLCKYLGRIRKERVPNFKEKPVFENVAPPPGVTGFAGMSPDAIHDPANRSKYEDAIRENRDNERQNSRQYELKRSEWAMRKNLRLYMMMTFKVSDVSTASFRECMSEGGFDDQERKEIEDQLKKIGTK